MSIELQEAKLGLLIAVLRKQNKKSTPQLQNISQLGCVVSIWHIGRGTIRCKNVGTIFGIIVNIRYICNIVCIIRMCNGDHF